MKLFKLALLSCLIFFLYGCDLKKETSEKKLPLPSSPPPIEKAFSQPSLGLSENENSLQTIPVGEVTYRYHLEIVDPAKITVGINHDLSQSSDVIAATQSCRLLTSGTFYDKQNQPMGLIVNQEKELSPLQENQLFNGVIGFYTSRTLLEVNSVNQLQALQGESSEWDWALQSGPVVIRDGKVTELQLKQDQQARRLVAGIKDNHLVLIIILGKDSLFDGPKLAKLGQIIQTIDPQISAAINLDGGTASAFWSPTIKLKELKSIGSYLCLH